MQDKEGKGKVNIGLRIVAGADVVKSEDVFPMASEAVESVLADTFSDLKLVGTEDSIVDPAGFKHDPDRPTDLNWGRYCEWRATKCPPSDERQPIDELNQATLEFIGELGELSNIVGMHGMAIMAEKELSDKIVDEAGDVYFTGTWALDAWGLNYLVKEFDQRNSGVSILDDADLAEEHKLFIDCKEIVVTFALDPNWEPTAQAFGCASSFEHYCRSVCLEALASGAVTANALKKLMFQKRMQDLVKQCQSIMISLSCAERLLAMCGKTINDALKANIEKLDARFPDGYQQGGGIRQGKGK